MATTGGGRGPLRPVPAAISNPAQTSRDRVAAYDEITRNVTLSKEFETYKLKFNEKTQSTLQHEVDGVAYRLGLGNIHTELEVFERIESILEDGKKLSSLPKLQAASDVLDTVIGTLGVGVKKDADIAAIVKKNVDDNLAFRNKAHENTLKLASNDAEIAKLTALTAGQKTAIDGYMDTVREHAAALGLKDKEIELLKAEKSTDNPVLAKLQTELREAKLQITVAESDLANEQRLMAELNKSSSIVEATNRELKRRLDLVDNAKLVTDKAVNAKDAYIAALSKSIVDMNFVLDAIMGEKEADHDAAALLIHRPVLLDGDPLAASNKLVLQTIDAFQADMKWVRNEIVSNAQKSKYIDALGEVIYGMRRMSMKIDTISATDKIPTPKLSAINEDDLQANKTDMLTAVGVFETAIQTIKGKLNVLGLDKQALTDALQDEKKRLGDIAHDMQLANNTLKGENVELTARIAKDLKITQNLALECDEAVRDLKDLRVKYDAVVSDITDVSAAVQKVPVHPLLDMNLDVPPSRAHASDKPADVVHDAPYTSRSYKSSSSSDTHDHKHVDDRLAMTLLHELQALVGPKFGLTDPDICDALAVVLAHVIEEQYRFAVMHQIYPTEFRRDDGEYISNVIVQGRISRYLKDRVYVPKSNTESKDELSDRLWRGEISENPTEGTERTDRRGGSGEKHTEGTERTDRRGGSGVLKETPRILVAGRKSNLSTPIANLLSDLRTMHDDM
jgi:hypothetical protein